MNRYQKLLSNTVLFAISTFSSKILVFLLMPLYTSVLDTTQYGTVDLLVQAANLMIPIVSLGIMNAVVRFGLDKGYSREGVFTAGVYAIGGGYMVFLALMPLLRRIPYLSFLETYSGLLCLYIFTACTRSLFSQFVRARNFTRLYAVDGLLSTLLTIGFNLWFLVALDMGVTGYLLAIVAADVVSSLFLLCVAQLYRYFRPSALRKSLFMEMIRYSLPMIPATVFWWITNVSDRYMVSALINEAANGLYAASYKIPTIVTLFSTIFTEAWQLSAVGERKSATRNQFFANIFLALQGVVFIAGTFLILLAKPIMRLLVSQSFFDAWQYIPVLIIATVFSCFSNFLASIYMVEKKSMQNLITTMVGAAVNIGLNLLLIPRIGVNGAAIATAISYFLVFVVRAINTQKYIHLRYAPVKLALNTALLAVQSALMLQNVKNWVAWCCLVSAGVVALNAGPILRSARRLLRRRVR